MTVDVQEDDLAIEEAVIVHGPAAIDFPPVNPAAHHWKQRGIMVECDSCGYAHGFALEVDQIVTGVDAKGIPIISQLA